MDYLLDTNIVIIYARASDLAHKLEAKYQLFSGEHNLAISVVTVGELKSIEKKFKYGEKKKKRIKKLLDQLLRIDINIEEIMERYSDIDAYSQGKLSSKSSDFTARNMGKNDLWIAATASYYEAILITTDKDFHHLNDTFLDLEYVDLQRWKKL